MSSSSSGTAASKLAGGSECSVVEVLRFRLVRQILIKCRLCSISTGCRCNGGGQAHVEGRTASWDSSGGKNISRPGLRSGEVSPLGSVVMPGSASFMPQTTAVRVVSSCGLGCAAGFCVLQLEGPGRSHNIDNGHLPPRFCYQVFSARW